MKFSWVPRTKRVLDLSLGWTLYKKLQLAPKDSLTHEQRLIVALQLVRTEVSSGGFDFFFRHPYGDEAQFAVEAARLAGCDALATLITTAIRRLSGDSFKNSAYEREKLIDASTIDFEDLDTAFYALESRNDLDAMIDEMAGRHTT